MPFRALGSMRIFSVDAVATQTPTLTTPGNTNRSPIQLQGENLNSGREKVWKTLYLDNRSRWTAAAMFVGTRKLYAVKAIRSRDASLDSDSLKHANFTESDH